MPTYTIDTVVEPTGVALDQPVTFTISPDMGQTITKMGVAVRYVDNVRRFVVYETDGFVAPFAPDSVAPTFPASPAVFTVFEYGGWRQRLQEIYVFGVQDNGVCFAEDILDG